MASSNIQHLSMSAITSYSVPSEARKILLDGLILNPLHSDLPPAVRNLSSNVIFEGNGLPSVPMNWRYAEAVSALKALEVTLMNVLIDEKYGVKAGEVVINTDRANLFYMAALLTRVDPDGDNAQVPPALDKYIKNKDYHDAMGSDHRRNATNLYRTKDGRYFYLHGGMNPDLALQAVGLPTESDAKGPESVEPFKAAIGQINSEDLERVLREEYNQAGTVAYTVGEYNASEHCKANEHVGIYKVHHIADNSQLPCWWPQSLSIPANQHKPLAGLKVVDLTRVIASPALTRALAEYGASVMRVSAPHICDYSVLHAEMNWGKWNCELDFRKEEDRAKLRGLILDADVVVDGYRPYVLEKYGFGKDAILELVKNSGRDRGIIYVRENCYGWNGPWASRPGWQQISDANTGISAGLAKAMGLIDGEAITPLFPTADYCSGLAGSSAVIQALIARGNNGGSFVVDVALNYFNHWLTQSVGDYPPDVWSHLWSLHKSPVFLPEHNLPGISIRCIQLLMQNAPGKIIRPDWLEVRESAAIHAKVKTVKPIAEWKDKENGVQPGFNVGTRGNGVDQPRWPDNLLQEVVED